MSHVNVSLFCLVQLKLSVLHSVRLLWLIMDAVTLVAAALAVACDDSRTAAMEQLLRDRELAAMRAADLECQAAQRGHVWSQQLPRPAQLPLHAYQRTWQQAYNELDAEYQNALNALQAVGVANANGDSNRVAELVRQELGEDAAPDGGESSSEAASVSDAPNSDDSQDSAVLRCSRCGDRENLHLMDQSGPWIDAESEAARTFCSDCLYG